ncbi:MAG: hypothetical protein ABI721_04995 [Candidatus Dojkabacteria bacterium]
MNTKLIQKSMRLPAKAVQIIDEDLKETLGIDFNDYVKSLVIEKAKEIQDKRARYMEDLKADVIKGREDHKAGRFTRLTTPQEIEDHFNNL